MSSTLTVVFDGARAEIDASTTALGALKQLDAIRGQVVAASVDGAEWDLDRPLADAADGDEVAIEPIYADTEQGRAILRHSTAHLMAQAVTDLFPGAKWAIGPPIDNGFYYDFDVAEPFTAEDLERIEARMVELMGQRQSFVREEVARDAAREEFADQPYKLEIIDAVDAGEIVSPVDAAADIADADGPSTLTVYRNVRPDGEVAWSDLCRGPHVPSSERVPAFRLLRSAGAYWRGREDRPMLQRIYGTAWESRKALQAHLEQLEEAAKRDHRRLGRELELTHFPDELGPGLSIFLPKGAIVRKQMEDWIRDEVLARGYDPVYTPHIAKEDLWHVSGHLQNYPELMYPAMEVDLVERGSEPVGEGDDDDDGQGGTAYRLKPMNCPFHILAYKSRIRSYRTFGFGDPSRVAVSTRPAKSMGADQDWERAEAALKEAVERTGLDYEIDEAARYRLKPMNCPFHILAYQSRTRSYRELPVRLSELGTVYRYEKSGVVNGQLRARGFTMDDSHIFCREDQVVGEVADCVIFAMDLYEAFGFGAPSRVAISTRPEKAFGEPERWDRAEKALVEAVEQVGLDYEIDEGEGAFYGPKIDIHLRDAIGREWQTTTVQVDFNLPERFDLAYVGEDGREHRPFMVHRALFGSIERFFAVMVESFNGAFPTWLAPVQATVVPVAADFDGYADQVAAALRDEGVRVEVDASDDTLGNKIRKASTAKVPYALIVGGNEEEARTVSVRPYRGDQRKGVALDVFVAEIAEEIRERVVPEPSS